MNAALWTHQPVHIAAVAIDDPPRDRTSRVERSLQHCKAEWDYAYAAAIEKGHTAQRALRAAQVAYKIAMPKMEDLSSIRAAIACTAQGITLEVFTGRDGSQLLYAAQVALATLQKKRAQRATTPPPSRPRSTGAARQ